MVQAKLQFQTIEDYLEYDDGTDTRYELKDGVLVEMPSESPINVAIDSFLLVSLAQFVAYYLIHRGTEVEVSSPSVSARCPDLLVITEAGWQAIAGKPKSLITLAMPNPVLVVEVVSPGDEHTPNYQRDYEEKPREYAARGIPEYWLIDPSREWVMVFRLDGEHYVETTFCGSEVVSSQAFPQLTLTAEQILSAGLPPVA